MYFRRLRDMRVDHDLSQAKLASRFGIQQTVYSRYERGKQPIPLSMLIGLAELYDVSVDYLLGRTDNPKVNR